MLQADAEAAPRQPLLSAKLHGGWISDVHLLASHAEAPAGHLLTAANDATCMLWDIGRLEGASPVCVCAARDLHSGTGHQSCLLPIFSMSECGLLCSQMHRCVIVCWYGMALWSACLTHPASRYGAARNQGSGTINSRGH